MAAAPLVIMAVGAAVSAVGAVRSSQAQAAASTYNAKLAEENAAVATAQGEAAAQAQSREAQRRIGTALATYGASGVQTDVGSPADVLADSARGAALDNMTIKYNAKLRAMGLQAQAGLDTMNAENATQAGYLNATSALLAGASSIYGASKKPPAQTGTGGVSLS